MAADWLNDELIPLFSMGLVHSWYFVKSLSKSETLKGPRLGTSQTLATVGRLCRHEGVRRKWMIKSSVFK
jgi:hypothetical protein